MIYSVLSDRLGNILFEIAAGISLARRLNVPFKAFVGQEDYRYVEYVLQYKRGCVKTKAHLLFYLKNSRSSFFVYATISSVIR